MKIPKVIRIGGIDYDIKVQPVVAENGRNCFGVSNYGHSVIVLADEISDYQIKCVTLIHEIIHVILRQGNMEIEGEKEEPTIDIIAHGIYQVLQDNGKKLFDLK